MDDLTPDEWDMIQRYETAKADARKRAQAKAGRKR